MKMRLREEGLAQNTTLVVNNRKSECTLDNCNLQFSVLIQVQVELSHCRGI